VARGRLPNPEFLAGRNDYFDEFVKSSPFLQYVFACQPITETTQAGADGTSTLVFPFILMGPRRAAKRLFEFRREHHCSSELFNDNVMIDAPSFLSICWIIRPVDMSKATGTGATARRNPLFCTPEGVKNIVVSHSVQQPCILGGLIVSSYEAIH
jgi:hypothetical protein